MPTTTFRSEVRNGPIDNNGITMSMIAADTSIALWGPVVLSGGSITDLPKAASTTTASNKNVIGVCVKLPRSGTITANTSIVEVLIWGIAKVKVEDATVNLNDALVTTTTAGKAKVQAAFTISATPTETEIQNALNGVRACFAIALSTVTSGADSIIAAFVNIVPYAGAQ